MTNVIDDSKFTHAVTFRVERYRRTDTFSPTYFYKWMLVASCEECGWSRTTQSATLTSAETVPSRRTIGTRQSCTTPTARASSGAEVALSTASVTGLNTRSKSNHHIAITPALARVWGFLSLPLVLHSSL